MAVKEEINATAMVCPHHADIVGDIKDIKAVLFDEEHGIKPLVSKTLGAWGTIKWILGGIGGIVLIGAITVFVNVVETPLKYAPKADIAAIQVQQALTTKAIETMSDSMKELTGEVKKHTQKNREVER